ncbi:MAG TPA: hypothetical protein VF477_07490 [Mycobacterium sp.]
MSHPTQREIVLKAIAALDVASNGLSEARNWLSAERPAGSAFPPAVADVRADTLRIIGDQVIGIEAAKSSLYDVLEQIGAHSAGRNGTGPDANGNGHRLRPPQ